MEIRLYKNNAEMIQVDKSNSLVLISTLEGTLRERTSLTAPSIALELDYTNNVFNYVYIPEFKRYYYVSNIVSENNGLWRVDLKCDVLMSYKDKIKEQKGLIDRQEYDFNEYLVDDRIIVSSKDSVIFKEISNTFFNTNPSTNDYVYLLSVASNPSA